MSKLFACGILSQQKNVFMNVTCMYCWFFLQGLPQFVILEFPQESQIKEIQIQFQGGFVGKECCVEGGPFSSSLAPFFEFYPDDSNTLQVSFEQFLNF